MKFSNQKFSSDVTLDYNEFTDCVIENCTVYYHGGPFSLTRTKLINVRYVFMGAADATLRLLRSLRKTQPRVAAELIAGTGGQLPPELLRKAN